MSAPKHTPGPWEVERHAGFDNGTTAVVRHWKVMIPATRQSGQAGDIVYVGRSGGDDSCHVVDGANARLIAAAPELLQALEAALPHLEDREDRVGSDHPLKRALTAARAAIAKARRASR